MPESFAIRVCGVRWRVDCSALHPEHAALAERLAELWARAAVEPDGSERAFVIALPGGAAYPEPAEFALGDSELDASARAVMEDPASFPYVLSRALTLASIAARHGQALMLHAAGLVSLQSQAPDSPAPALVLVAGSGTGKSTAVRELGRSYGYLTDECVVIEPDLTISPHPKPISLAAATRPGDKDEFSPDELGLARTPAAARVGAVVLLRRDPGVSVPTVAPTGLIDGMLDALAQSSAIQLLDAPLQWLARAMVRGGGPYRLSYADAASCGAAVAELFGAAYDPACAATDMTPPFTEHAPLGDAMRLPVGTRHAAADSVGDVAAHVGEIPMPTAVRAPYTDAIEAGGEVLVLRGVHPARLSGIGATVWLAATEPTTLATFIERAIAEHGHHPFERTLTAIAIEDLIDAGLLARPAH